MPKPSSRPDYATTQQTFWQAPAWQDRRWWKTRMLWLLHGGIDTGDRSIGAGIDVSSGKGD